MEDHIKFEIGWKQKAKEKPTLGMRRLFGIIRNIHGKINHSKPATTFPTYATAKMLKDHQTKVEQKKAEAIEILRRRLTI